MPDRDIPTGSPNRPPTALTNGGGTRGVSLTNGPAIALRGLSRPIIVDTKCVPVITMTALNTPVATGRAITGEPVPIAAPVMGPTVCSFSAAYVGHARRSQARRPSKVRNSSTERTRPPGK